MTSSPDFQSYTEMAEEGERYVRELETWFEDHGPGSRKPWPEINIANKQRRLAWVIKTVELLRRAAAKQEAA